MASTTEIVKLNIGGTVFQTTKSTLTRFDGFFKTILETDVPVIKDETGAFFIDRDPTHFRLILNFMRNGHVKLPAGKDTVEEISEEAQYYLLTGLVELCLNRLRVELNNELFKVLHSEDEESLAVLNSKKPVLIIYSCYRIVDYVNIRDYHKWKQFIEKHSQFWKIYFSKADKDKWCIHRDGKTFSDCSLYGGKYSCGHPYSYNSDPYLIHLEYHMNRCLTHPEKWDLNYEEFSRFSNQ